MDAICEHLEAQSYGQIKNLIVNIPPRFTKTLLVSVFWPAWEWTWKPTSRWLCCSYDYSLAVRDSVKCRQLLRSDWYQSNWPLPFTADQDQKGLFVNAHNGHRKAISIGGMVTGEGGDHIVVDDPHNVQQAESDAIRDAAITWWKDSMQSRLNDAKTGTKTIVMQRVHQQDLVGHLLEHETTGWDHLCLPMEYELAHPFPSRTKLKFKDPRTIEGELLSPDRFDATFVAGLKQSMTDVAYAGQYQERPAPKGGSLFRREWFRYYGRRGNYYVLNPNLDDERVLDAKLQFKLVFLTADTASTEKNYSDYTAICAWALTRTYDLLLLDVLRAKMIIPKLKPAILTMVNLWNPRFVGIEEKNSGQGLVQDLRTTTGLNVLSLKPDASKVDRSQDAQIRMKAGQIYFPLSAAKTWLPQWESELLQFNAAQTYAHDDQVDCLSYAAIIAANRAASGKLGRPGAA